MQALDTHDVFNQFDELTDINLLQADTALQEVLLRQQAQGFVPALSRFAQQLGEKQNWEHAELANRHTPELQRFDARGRVLDAVEFHPSWHRLMQLYREQGLISLPFESQGRGRWSAWAAGFYLHGQVEQGTLCPATMTTAAIPVLQKRAPALEPVAGSVVQPRVRPTRSAAGPEKIHLDRHGHDGKTGRLGRARQHHGGPPGA